MKERREQGRGGKEGRKEGRKERRKKGRKYERIYREREDDILKGREWE